MFNLRFDRLQETRATPQPSSHHSLLASSPLSPRSLRLVNARRGHPTRQDGGVWNFVTFDFSYGILCLSLPRLREVHPRARASLRHGHWMRDLSQNATLPRRLPTAACPALLPVSLRPCLCKLSIGDLPPQLRGPASRLLMRPSRRCRSQDNLTAVLACGHAMRG